MLCRFFGISNRGFVNFSLGLMFVASLSMKFCTDVCTSEGTAPLSLDNYCFQKVKGLFSLDFWAYGIASGITIERGWI